jgi:hypothetical protein
MQPGDLADTVGWLQQLAKKVLQAVRQALSAPYCFFELLALDTTKASSRRTWTEAAKLENSTVVKGHPKGPLLCSVRKSAIKNEKARQRRAVSSVNHKKLGCGDRI